MQDTHEHRISGVNNEEMVGFSRRCRAHGLQPAERK
jgi:hypothetical protein